MAVGRQEGENAVFEWLDEELATIKTRKFHLVDGPISPANGTMVESSELGVPNSYKEFVMRFGNAKLYRFGSTYALTVFAVPRDATVEGESLLCFGESSASAAFFNEQICHPSGESPVFEWTKERGLHNSAAGFEEWLKRNADLARSNFSRKRWMEIVKGPRPFSSRELKLVEARRQFRCKAVGVAANGDMLIEVQNGSEMILPYLSLGVRTPKFNGGVWIETAEVIPGSTRIIAKDCYKDIVAPHDVELFVEPDPDPEDRDRYWEFRNSASDGAKE